MGLASRPFWLVGFRPFFTLACLSGMFMPLAWVLVYGGALPVPHTRLTPVQWHAHEMFFGFGWAVLGGFLLTATKNWVSIRGYHGPALMLLAAAWILERIAMTFGANWPPLIFLLAANAFLGAIVVMLLWTLIRNHARDDYRDNGFFLIALPTFIIAKQLMLDDRYFHAGYMMTLALFRVAFLVMLERTLTQFMKSNFQVEILRNVWLDRAIKVLGLMLVLEPFLPVLPAATLSVLLAALLLWRFMFWKPLLAFARIELAIMYIGYLAIAAQLVVQAVDRTAGLAWTGTISVHLFTFGVMGVIIPAMLIRIAKGHTGHKVVFDALDRAVLWVMLGALALRIVFPQLAPASYLLWIELAAACWFACFATIAWRYVPYLLRARVDGKEH